jgi:hypothetical protein
LVTRRRAKYGSCDTLCAAEICFHQAGQNDYVISGQSCTCTASSQGTCGMNMNRSSPTGACVCKGAGYNRVHPTDDSKGCYLDVLQTAFGNDVTSVSSFVEANLFEDAITVMKNTGALGKYNVNEKNAILAHFTRFFLGQDMLLETDFTYLNDAYYRSRSLGDKGLVVSQQCYDKAYNLGEDLVMADLVTMGLTTSAAATIFNPTVRTGLRMKFTDTLLAYDGVPSNEMMKKAAVQVHTDFFTSMKWENFRAAFLMTTGQSAQATADSAHLFLNQLLAVIATRGYSLKSMTDGLMGDISNIYDDHRTEMAECFTDAPDSTLCNLFSSVSGTGSSTIMIDMTKSSSTRAMKFNMVYDCYGDYDDVEVWYEGKQVRDFKIKKGRQTPTPITYGPGNSQLVEIRVFSSVPTSTWKIESLSCAEWV